MGKPRWLIAKLKLLAEGLWKNKKLTAFLLIILGTCHFLGYYDWIYEVFWPIPHSPVIIVNGVLDTSVAK